MVRNAEDVASSLRANLEKLAGENAQLRKYGAALRSDLRRTGGGRASPPPGSAAHDQEKGERDDSGSSAQSSPTGRSRRSSVSSSGSTEAGVRRKFDVGGWKAKVEAKRRAAGEKSAQAMREVDDELHRASLHRGSRGRINPEQVRTLIQLSAKHGSARICRVAAWI